MACVVNCRGGLSSVGVLKKFKIKDYDNYGPWVEIKFLNNGKKITVGNKSSPASPGTKSLRSSENKAAILSWQYGFAAATGGSGAGGYEMKIEIIDEEGGTFANFVKKTLITNTEKGEYSELTLDVRWGWTGSSCSTRTPNSSGSNAPETIQNLRPVRIGARDVEVTMADGKLLFTILCAHPVNIVAKMTAERGTYGSETNRMPLKHGIREVYKEFDIDVKFLTKTQPSRYCHSEMECGVGASKSKCWEWSFRKNDGGCDGYLGVWRTEGKDVNTAVLTWLSERRTVDGKGFVIGTDASAEKATVIIWESPLPKCDGKGFPIQNLGTYIVNGGKCSSVISFSPKYIFSGGFPNSLGGNFISTSAENVDATKEQECELFADGTPVKTPSSQNLEDQHGPDAQKEQEKSNQANLRAQTGFKTIQADLVIIGDPTFSDPLLMTPAFVTIIVINPYFIDMSGGGKCGKWKISGSTCNDLASNRNWSVTGVDHQIKAGTYTTTFKLALAVGGYDINKGLPIGGTNSGAPTLSS